jgi:Family of unknown function (DUF6186)
MTSRVVTAVGFGVIIAAMVLLEVIARRRTNKIPTTGEWLGYVMRPRAGRALILLGWLWLGWHYFAR